MYLMTNLKRIRLEKGLKQLAVARFAGISRQTLGLMEQNKFPVSIENRVKLAKIYEVHPNELL